MLPTSTHATYEGERERVADSDCMVNWSTAIDPFHAVSGSEAATGVEATEFCSEVAVRNSCLCLRNRPVKVENSIRCWKTWMGRSRASGKTLRRWRPSWRASAIASRLRSNRSSEKISQDRHVEETLVDSAGIGLFNFWVVIDLFLFFSYPFFCAGGRGESEEHGGGNMQVAEDTGGEEWTASGFSFCCWEGPTTKISPTFPSLSTDSISSILVSWSCDYTILNELLRLKCRFTYRGTHWFIQSQISAVQGKLWKNLPILCSEMPFVLFLLYSGGDTGKVIRVLLCFITLATLIEWFTAVLYCLQSEAIKRARTWKLLWLPLCFHSNIGLTVGLQFLSYFSCPPSLLTWVS